MDDSYIINFTDNPRLIDQLTVFFGAFLKGWVVKAGIICPHRPITAAVIGSRGR